MKSVVVYCGSREGNNPRYVAAAKDLGKLLAQQEIALVYGGGSVGLMGAISDEMMSRRGKVFGVITEQLNTAERGNTKITQLVMVKTMHERKAEMCRRADGAIILPGAYGTLDELFEFVTWTQLGIHHKPCGILNVGGFYDHLINHIDLLVKEGFLLPRYRELIVTATNADSLIGAMLSWKDARPHPEAYQRV